MEPAFFFVNMNSCVVDQAVCTAPCVAWSDPRHALIQVRQHLVQRHITVAVKVNEAYLVKNLVVIEHADIKQLRHSIVNTVIFLPRSQHDGVNCVGVDVGIGKQFFGQPCFKQLTTRQTGHDKRNLTLLGSLHAERVNRLEATLANVGMTSQAVGKDLLHCWGRSIHVIDIERLDQAIDIGFCSVGDVSIVQRKGEYLQAHLCQAAQHIRAVFAATEQ